jgi:hypothetical protein
VVTTLA